MIEAGFHVRAMTRGELDIAVDWAAAEGWNPGLFDADAFQAADPGGFLVGVADGVPVSSISVVAYGTGFGFLGFYIVHPNHRGRGYGIATWRAGMVAMAGRSVGLDGVVAQQANYHRSGFTLAHRNQRFEGQGGSRDPGGTVPVSSLPFADVADYDAQLFGLPREAFLSRWITMPQSVALGVVRQGRLVGYGVLRRCRYGHKIAPLFADAPDVAETLFAALAAQVPGEAVFLDVPQPNAAALALAERHAMRPVFETARMYTGGDPGVPLDRVFGITSFELG